MANLFYKWKYIPFDSFSLTHLHPLTLVTVSQRKNAYMRSLLPNKKVIYFFLLICKRSWLEKAMATHSSTPAWKIPWREEVPGRLQSMGSRRVGHDWTTSFSLFTFMHWRRKWQPTPVLLPEKSHGQRSMAGYSPGSHKESDMTECVLTLTL